MSLHVTNLRGLSENVFCVDLFWFECTLFDSHFLLVSSSLCWTFPFPVAFLYIVYYFQLYQLMVFSEYCQMVKFIHSEGISRQCCITPYKLAIESNSTITILQEECMSHCMVKTDGRALHHHNFCYSFKEGCKVINLILMVTMDALEQKFMLLTGPTTSTCMCIPSYMSVLIRWCREICLCSYKFLIHLFIHMCVDIILGSFKFDSCLLYGTICLSFCNSELVIW